MNKLAGFSCIGSLLFTGAMMTFATLRLGIERRTASLAAPICTEWKSRYGTHRVLIEIDGRGDWLRRHKADVEAAQEEFPQIQ